MKRETRIITPIPPMNFSTLDSGLRDETGKGSRAGGQETGHFSTLDSGLRDETWDHIVALETAIANFSTLDSGLRDETGPCGEAIYLAGFISVPSTRVYAMKRTCITSTSLPTRAISVPSTRVYAMKPGSNRRA